MSLNLAKSIFGVSWGKLLGHIFKDSSISIDLERVCVIQNLPPPATKKDMQSFMGKINFVRRFIHEFSRMVKPIHNLHKKEHEFSWSQDTERGLVDIKKAIFAPMLAQLDFLKDFVIYNTIEKASLAILLQKDDLGSKQSIDFMILSLSNVELKYTLIEKNSFSLVKVAEKFRHFILGKHTKVKVPLPTIKFLLSQTFLLGNLAH
jgi:hypothetical protein